MVCTWDKNYVKYDGHDVEPVNIFPSFSEESGKSHLVTVIYNAIWKTLFYHRNDPEKARVLLRGPPKISAVNVGGTTIQNHMNIHHHMK